MKFNDTQTSYNNEQSSYINYSGFNPFPSSGHLSREADGRTGCCVHQVPPGRCSRRSRVHVGDCIAWLLGAPTPQITRPDQSEREKHSQNNEQPFEEEPDRRKREELTKGNKSYVSDNA